MRKIKVLNNTVNATSMFVDFNQPHTFMLTRGGDVFYSESFSRNYCHSFVFYPMRVHSCVRTWGILFALPLWMMYEALLRACVHIVNI